jgi:hypothetical protein
MKEQILKKWQRGHILASGELSGTPKRTLEGIAIMMKSEITEELKSAVKQLIEEGKLIGNIDHFMTVEKNLVDHMIYPPHDVTVFLQNKMTAAGIHQ